MCYVFFFFFSSRRRHTRSLCDWSSDVCSSDLDLAFTISGTVFPYGAFLNALISFLIIAAVVFFFVVRPMNAVMARLKRSDEEPDAPTAEVTVLSEIRDLLAAQRGPGA